MTHPVKFSRVAKIVGLVELFAEELERSLVRLVDRQRSPQKHYVLNRLQLGHVAGQHQREQIDNQMRVTPNRHVGQFAKVLESLKT
jgi:hypothetical protein